MRGKRREVETGEKVPRANRKRGIRVPSKVVVALAIMGEDKAEAASDLVAPYCCVSTSVAISIVIKQNTRSIISSREH